MGTCQCEKSNSSTEKELNNFFTRNQIRNRKIDNNDNNEMNSDLKLNIVNEEIQEEYINQNEIENEEEEEEKEEEDEEENEQEKENTIKENTARNKLKEAKYLKNAKIINNFILKNLNNIYAKDKYNKFKIQAKKIFFENEEINFNFDQSYFKHLFDSKLLRFLNNKENIIKDLFTERFRKSLYSFPKLKEIINNEHNNCIYNNHREFLNEFMSYGVNNNIININNIESRFSKQIEKEIMNKKNSNSGVNDISNNNNYVRQSKRTPSIRKIISLKLYPNQNQNNKIKQKSIDIKADNFRRRFKTSKTKNYSNYNFKKNVVISEDSKNNSYEKEKNNKNNLIPVQEKITKENILKKELDKFYDVCFASKLSFSEFEKTSIFFNLITKGRKEKAFTGELKNLVNIFYYIYILKKYDYLSDTNKCFYKINSSIIIRKSMISNQMIINRKESFSKRESILKMKILKGIFNKKNEKESDSSDSMYSNLSKEDKKEINPNFSKNKYLFLSKHLSKHEINIGQIPQNKENDLFLINENLEDLRSEGNKSIHNMYIEKAELLEKDKKSYKDIINFDDMPIKKKNTSPIKKNQSEYYNGQYDNTIYLYAGLGTLVSNNLKKLYYGTFRYGKKEGMGISYHLNENFMEYFMGEFHNNKKFGFGTKISITNKELIHLEGTFKGDNIIKGTYKKIFLKNINTIITTHYLGNFENTKFSGSGKMHEKTYIFDQKTCIYEIIQIVEYIGEFFNGKKNGKGKEMLKHFKYNTKNYRYEGNFINGVKDGYGKIIYDKSNFVQKYEGFFVKDKPFQIYGIIDFKSGDVYEGFFENNLKDYVGLYLFRDSKSKKFIEEYLGGFLEDYKDGIGRTIVQDSEEVKMLRGNYKRGDKEGQFEKVISKIEDVKNKKRRFGTIEEAFFESGRISGRIREKQPIIQIKSFPIYEENEIVDINDNYLYELDY